jgi:Subtilase family.
MKKIILLILLFPVLIYAQSPFGEIVVTTRLSETYYDKNGNILTGKGVVVGDVDSGVDVFHPMFFFADGGKYEWIDVESDGKFTQGIDGIDFNGNNVIDANEQLRILKMRDETWGMLGPSSASFTIDKDFLYLDANGNGYRDYGPKSGFKESDPTYGELLFIAIDENDNKRLDVQETLIALKTSKIRAVREKDGNIRRRGIDLIETEPDSVSHGTGVAGIVMGGHYGVQRIHGIAPDAEMVFANIKYEYTPRFVRIFLT